MSAGQRWTLPSSRVPASGGYDQEEATGLLKTSSRHNKNRPWKANKDSDDDDDAYEDLIPMQDKAAANKETCMEAEVQPGETLASVALKYNIPPAELKRVNNLLKDAEFYALKRIKIPVKPASLLTEILDPVDNGPDENGWYIRTNTTPTTGYTSTTVQSSTPHSETGSQMDPLDVPVSHQLIDLGTTPPQVEPVGLHTASKEAKKANRFLRGIDKDLARIKEKTERISTTPEREGEDGGDGELNLSSLTASGDYMTTKLIMPHPNARGRHDDSWCSKSGLCCALLIVISVMAIMALAHWLYFNHKEVFIRDPEHIGQHHDNSGDSDSSSNP